MMVHIGIEYGGMRLIDKGEGCSSISPPKGLRAPTGTSGEPASKKRKNEELCALSGH